ncbi:hypothetical protein UFOVP1229_38 [uncultured Caudovirales phage]|uniref:Uncharacterized protein n=1 Tax=uncultured Caudovirales phage TaxID=2100421 RepID=A0A6J5R433_9CAUD|nr:hypothetical protein UFOVP1229_38 [uncultured Caudovirales phage]
MQAATDDIFLVIDRGAVVFRSTSFSAAQGMLSAAGRGVLCKVLCAELSDFIQQNTDTKKLKRKVRPSDSGG